MKQPNLKFLAVALLMASALVAPAGAATTTEWTGTSSTDWKTNGNWTSGRPASGEIALFSSLGIARANVSLADAYTIAGITFGTGASVSYILGGAQTLSLTGTPTIQQQSANAQTISMAGGLALLANTTIDITGAGNLSLSAAITSSGKNITRTGTGTGKLILSGSNSGDTGSVFVNAGIVQAANSNALGTGATTVLAGATLELSGGIAPTNAMSVAGSGVGGNGAIRNVSGTNTVSGTVTETAAATIVADTGTTLNLTGNVTGTNIDTAFAGGGIINVAQITTGSGQVGLSGSGTVTFNGGSTANTYTGLTTVNSGTLSLSKTAGTTAISTGGLQINGGTVSLAAGNQIADGAAVALANSATFNLNGQAETIGQLNSASASAATTLGAGSLTLGGASNSTYAGSITGSAGSSFNVGGTGTVSLSGNSASFAGAVNVTNGTLNVSSSNSVLGTGTVAVSSVGNLQVQGGISLANTVSINGTGTAGNGAIENVSGNNALNGSVTLGGNSRIQSDAGTLTIGGGVTLGSNTLNAGGSGDVSVTGVISGLGGLTKDGAGALHLAAGNSFSGTTVITAGSIVTDASNAFNNSAAMTIGVAGTLSLQSYSQTIGSLAGSGTVNFGTSGQLTLSSGSATFSGTFTGAGTLIIGAGASLTLGADFNNSNLNITLAGGSLFLNGSNSTFGALNITGNSILDFGNSAASMLHTSSITAGATLSVNNWVNTVDYFYTQNFVGATIGVRGQAPQNNVDFSGSYSGFTNDKTYWQGNDHQITPAPEPATYGLCFVGACLGFTFWRRRRAQVAKAA